MVNLPLSWHVSWHTSFNKKWSQHVYLSRETYDLRSDGLGSNNIWDFRGFLNPSKLTLGHNNLTWVKSIPPTSFPTWIYLVLNVY